MSRLCAVQVVKEAELEELPWCAMAILHIMAAPACVAGAGNAAPTLLGACSSCMDGAVSAALHDALHAAIKRQPCCAGALSSCLIPATFTLIGCCSIFADGGACCRRALGSPACSHAAAAALCW